MYVEAYETSRSFYESQLYKVFVISDVCNRSLCVIPFFYKPNKGLCNNYQEEGGGGAEKLEGGHYIKMLPR